MSATLPSSGGYRIGSRRRTTEDGAMSEINVTNLVDVILVLLIIFMISAPLLQSGIEVDLPKTNSTAINPEEEGLIVTIDTKSGIYIADKWSRLDNFEENLKKELKKASTDGVYLRADSLVSYGVVIDVISRLRAAGVTEIGLITQPREKKRGRRR